MENVHSLSCAVKEWTFTPDPSVVMLIQFLGLNEAVCVLRGRSTFCVARQVMLRIFNSTGMRRDLQAGGEWEVGVAESSYGRWPIGVKVSRVLGERCLPVQDVSWVIWLLKVSELLSSRCAIDWGGDLETRRHRFLDVCASLSMCVCLFFRFILYCFYTNLALYFRRSLCADR